jgi:hypothetical protein
MYVSVSMANPLHVRKCRRRSCLLYRRPSNERFYRSSRQSYLSSKQPQLSSKQPQLSSKQPQLSFMLQKCNSEL